MALQESKKYKDIADKLIDKFPVALGHISIDEVVFLCESEKTPKKYADTRKIGWPYNHYIDRKYMIIFYENNIVPMTQAQVHMLVFHELLHIAPDFEKLRKHDIEDFRELVSMYGVNWDIDPNLVDILDDDEDVARPTKIAHPFDDDDEEEEPEF